MGKSQKIVLKAEMYLEGQKFKENEKSLKQSMKAFKKMHKFIL